MEKKRSNTTLKENDNIKGKANAEKTIIKNQEQQDPNGKNLTTKTKNEKP